jgi:uncharacterized protein (TIGR02246 family)
VTIRDTTTTRPAGVAGHPPTTPGPTARTATRPRRAIERLAVVALLMAPLGGCAVRSESELATRGPAPAGAVTAAATARAEIDAMLARAAAAWTRGDLDAFMSDYRAGDSTTFVGRAGVLRGPAAIRANYAARFAPGAVRDSLSFERLEVDLLAPDVAHALAYYVLSRGDSVTARGPTSLVLRREGGRWRIVHDHSS